ncbi:MAG: sugar phosphate isomerase/epimerase [Planctomycetota bacterium]|nr:sugar phosphate isomerase/epimerase [Planctomycetota bacterium]
MRLGGPIFGPAETPEQWLAEVKKEGYTAAYAPGAVQKGPLDRATCKAYEDAARAAGVVIAEVGAWSNPISSDAEERRKAMELCQQRLALADALGARCCVNITGSRGSKWDGPNADNLTQETFDMIVECTRAIVDAVKPTRTFYALETMPWALPDSADSYVALLKAIDRKSCAVHLDPVNLVNCPSRYYDTAALIRDCFAKLGPQIKSCHAKDILMSKNLTVHLDEVPPGQGGLDYKTYLRELNRLDPDVPLMLEHMKDAETYRAAAAHIRAVAAAEEVTVR